MQARLATKAFTFVLVATAAACGSAPPARSVGAATTATASAAAAAQPADMIAPSPSMRIRGALPRAWRWDDGSGFGRYTFDATVRRADSPEETPPPILIARFETDERLVLDGGNAYLHLVVEPPVSDHDGGLQLDHIVWLKYIAAGTVGTGFACRVRDEGADGVRVRIALLDGGGPVWVDTARRVPGAIVDEKLAVGPGVFTLSMTDTYIELSGLTADNVDDKFKAMRDAKDDAGKNVWPKKVSDDTNDAIRKWIDGERKAAREEDPPLLPP